LIEFEFIMAPKKDSKKPAKPAQSKPDMPPKSSKGKKTATLATKATKRRKVELPPFEDGEEPAVPTTVHLRRPPSAAFGSAKAAAAAEGGAADEGDEDSEGHGDVQELMFLGDQSDQSLPTDDDAYYYFYFIFKVHCIQKSSNIR
jgi:hypothetical protein